MVNPVKIKSSLGNDSEHQIKLEYENKVRVGITHRAWEASRMVPDE